jgi:outer membrane protein assembly factor BamB
MTRIPRKRIFRPTQVSVLEVAMKRISLVILILCVSFASAAWSQQPTSNCSNNWSEFHRTNMERWNPCETVLNVHNVGGLVLKWSYTTSNMVESSPAVVNGAVYVGSVDNNVYALNATTGAKLWSHNTGHEVHEPSPAVANGVVYGGSDHQSVYALNARTGHKLWSTTTGSASASPTVANGVVYVGGGGGVFGEVYALNAKTGATLWRYPTAVGLTGNSSSALADGVVYADAEDDRDGLGSVFALDAKTGTLLWNFPYVFGTVGAAPVSSPAVANGMVYVGSNHAGSPGYFYALKASTGALLWSYASELSAVSSPAVANGVVYIGSGDSNVYALDAKTGVKLWSYTTGGSLFSSPAVANGVVYIGSLDDKVYAFGLK